METEPVSTCGDAADDPAIWVHPADPAQSLVIGANKKLGLEVYDLAGRRVQTLPDGRMNNVDLRDGFRFGGERVALVAASNRTNKTIALYRVDPAARRLIALELEDAATGLSDPYGVCLYRSARNDRFYVFVNDADTGLMRQWQLEERRGRVRAKRVRDMQVGSQAEGCVADDELGWLYVGEEDMGLWKYGAEPGAGTERTAVDRTEGGNLTADVEGMSSVARPGGRVISSCPTRARTTTPYTGARATTSTSASSTWSPTRSSASTARRRRTGSMSRARRSGAASGGPAGCAGRSKPDAGGAAEFQARAVGANREALGLCARTIGRGSCSPARGNVLRQ